MFVANSRNKNIIVRRPYATDAEELSPNRLVMMGTKLVVSFCCVYLNEHSKFGANY